MYKVVLLHHMARPKIHKINEGTFNGNLNQKTAYCLGLILSDGHLNYAKGSFQYACKTDDERLIETILKTVESSHPIKRYEVKGKNYSRVSISNVAMVRGIIDLFNLPKMNKSLNNLFIPKNIPKNLMRHFLRGFFDGDGSIWKSNGRFVCAYTGGENMMLDIQRELSKLKISSKLTYRHGKSNKNSCSLVISTHANIEKLCSYLYDHADFFLKRKKDLFVEHTKAHKKHKSFCLRFNGNGEKIKKMYLSGVSQKNISENLRIPFSTVRAHIQLLRRRNEVV